MHSISEKNIDRGKIIPKRVKGKIEQNTMGMKVIRIQDEIL